MRWVWGITTAAVVLVAVVVFPQVLMLVCLSHDGPALGAIHGLREKVLLHRTEKGRFPDRLEEVGLPTLTVFSYGPQPEERIHRHKVEKVETRRGLGAEGFAVEFSTWLGPWAKPASSVSVVGDFNGFDPARGMMKPSGDRTGWSLPVQLSTGAHSFRFIVDGRETGLETLTFDHALSHPSVAVKRPDTSAYDGVWVYDPDTGLVLLACDGTDTKHRRPWRTH